MIFRNALYTGTTIMSNDFVNEQEMTIMTMMQQQHGIRIISVISISLTILNASNP